MGKVRLFIRARGKHGAFIASVPLNQLVELSKCRKLRWCLVDNVLVLEGF